MSDTVEKLAEAIEQIDAVESEPLPWSVNDPMGATEIDEETGVLTTTLPDGTRIGWDTCGCGYPVTICQCEEIRLPKMIVSLRAQFEDRVGGVLVG